MTMTSRVLGLIRDVTIANYFGSKGEADAFFVAFKIPNFFRRLFAEGAFSQAFVPVLSEYRTQRSIESVRDLVSKVSGLLGGVLILLTVLVVIASPLVAILFAPGFWMNDSEKYQLTSSLIAITFPYLMLISLAGLASAVLNSYDRFMVPAITPALLNICLLSATVVSSRWFDEPVFALAWGVMLAGVVQLLFQLPFLAKIHLLPPPKLDWRDSGVRRILLLMVPALFGVSVSQINLLLDVVIASFLPTGSVSWLYYSDRLAELPLGVFGIAIATVILPSLSRQYSRENSEKFGSTIDWALRLVLLLGLPAAIALVILAEPILLTLFGYGEMTLRDIEMASWSLCAYAFGLCGFMLIKVLAPGYFSRQDMKTPVRIGIIAMTSNMVMNLVFVWILHDQYQLGHVGLAAATTLSAFLNAGLLYRGLRKEKVYQPQPNWVRFSLQLLFSLVVMATGLLLALQYLNGWLEWSVWQRALNMALICVGGGMLYVGALLVAGVRVSQLKHVSD